MVYFDGISMKENWAGKPRTCIFATTILENIQYRNSKRLLLLDEVTSALDACSKSIVKKSLDYLMIGRINVVGAHHLSTIKNENIIFFV